MTWPASLPQFFSLAGYDETLPDNRQEAKTEYGPGKSRPRFTRQWRVIQGSILCDSAQVDAFETFYYDDLNGGATEFVWVNPVTQIPGRFRFTKPEPVITYIDGDQFSIQMRLFQTIARLAAFRFDSTTATFDSTLLTFDEDN